MNQQYDETSPVAIGLPVYNGERYLEDTLRSVLNQTFDNFDLFIADNASTDRTEEICRDYAGRDSRIRYIRNSINLGASKNCYLTKIICQHARQRKEHSMTWPLHYALHISEALV